MLNQRLAFFFLSDTGFSAVQTNATALSAVYSGMRENGQSGGERERKKETDWQKGRERVR